MKKAVISTGSKQFLVAEGDIIDVELLTDDKPKFEALLVIDGDSVTVGTPSVSGVSVTTEVIDPELKGEKVLAIRYKAKKRVHKVRGHRQRFTRLKITKIN